MSRAQSATTSLVVANDESQSADLFSIIRLAVEHQASVEQLERLMALKRVHDADVAKRAYVQAMATAKAELPLMLKKTNPVKNANGSTRYKHAKLGDICAQIIPILSRHGISHDWSADQVDSSTVTVCCRLTHVGGHTEQVALIAPMDVGGGKNALQALGSSVRYLQRYTLESALGIVEGDDDEEDDDGRLAGDSPKSFQPKPTPTTPTPTPAPPPSPERPPEVEKPTEKPEVEKPTEKPRNSATKSQIDEIVMYSVHPMVDERGREHLVRLLEKPIAADKAMAIIGKIKTALAERMRQAADESQLDDCRDDELENHIIDAEHTRGIL